MDFLLRGNHPVLATLRDQFAVAIVKEPDFTGVGFFIHFVVPTTAVRLERDRLVLGDVHADLQGLQHGAGFLLFIEEGAISILECFTYEEPWPANAQLSRLYYLHPERPGSGSLVEVSDRDLDWALRRR